MLPRISLIFDRIVSSTADNNKGAVALTASSSRLITTTLLLQDGHQISSRSLKRGDEQSGQSSESIVAPLFNHSAISSSLFLLEDIFNPRMKELLLNYLLLANFKIH
jgi:hypothetical protein